MGETFAANFYVLAQAIVAHQYKTRRMNMNRAMSSAITSAAVGMIAGTAAYMMTGSDHSSMQKTTRKIRRTAGKAVKNAGIILDGVYQMMR